MIICIHLQDPQGPLQCQQLGLTELQKQLSPAAAPSLHAAQCGSLSLCTSSCSALRLQLAFPEKLHLKRCVLSPLHAAWIEVARLANVGVNPGWYSAAAWQPLRMVMHANTCNIGSRLSPVLSDDERCHILNYQRAMTGTAAQVLHVRGVSCAQSQQHKACRMTQSMTTAAGQARSAAVS